MERIRKFLPNYKPMGRTGMGEMFHNAHGHPPPANLLPFGPFGIIEMGGMFTILKVDGLL